MPLTQHKVGVYLAVLNQGSVRPELSYLTTRWVIQNKYNVYLAFPAEKPISNNRNKIVLDFLKRKDLDYLIMIDSDIVPPLNFLDLLDHKKAIISPVCYAFRQGAIVPLILKANDEGTYNVMDVSGDEGLIEVDALGTGAMIIHRKVLEDPKMKAPFENIYDENGVRVRGLDLSFCRKAKEIGYPVFCHLNFTCSHWVKVDLKMIYNAMVARETKAFDNNFEMKRLDGQKLPNKRRFMLQKS